MNSLEVLDDYMTVNVQRMCRFFEGINDKAFGILVFNTVHVARFDLGTFHKWFRHGEVIKMPKRSRVFLSVSLLIVGMSGCASARAYGKARLDDMRDVIDFKWSVGGDNMGFGVKVEPLVFLGSGIGYANLGTVQEEFGRARRSREVISSPPYVRFFHIGVFGADTSGGVHDNFPPVDTNILLFNWCPYWEDKLSPLQYCFRTGGEIVIPWFYGGVYLNTGELIELLAGIFGLDPSGDDRVSEEDDGDK